MGTKITLSIAVLYCAIAVVVMGYFLFQSSILGLKGFRTAKTVTYKVTSVSGGTRGDLPNYWINASTEVDGKIFTRQTESATKLNVGDEYTLKIDTKTGQENDSLLGVIFPKKFFAVLFLNSICLFLGLVAIKNWKDSFEQIRHSTNMLGEVVEVIKTSVKRQGKAMRENTYVPVYQYEYQGKLYRNQTTVGHSSSFQVGEKRKILVDNRDPNNIMTNSFIGTWGFMATIFFVGAGFGFLGFMAARKFMA